jgi:hypothetical protein
MSTTTTTIPDGYYITTVSIPETVREAFRDYADEWADTVGSLRGSIEDGDGNFAGKFGELLFQHVFGGRIVDGYDYDLLYNGLTIDVKTKRRTVHAEPHYEASIADWNPDQSCDLYYFVSVVVTDTDAYHTADLCGYLSPDAYHNRATFHEQGDRDPDNNFEFTADCWNLAYKHLNRKRSLPRRVVL